MKWFLLLLLTTTAAVAQLSYPSTISYPGFNGWTQGTGTGTCSPSCYTWWTSSGYAESLVAHAAGSFPHTTLVEDTAIGAQHYVELHWANGGQPARVYKTFVSGRQTGAFGVDDYYFIHVEVFGVPNGSHWPHIEVDVDGARIIAYDYPTGYPCYPYNCTSSGSAFEIKVSNAGSEWVTFATNELTAGTHTVNIQQDQSALDSNTAIVVGEVVIEPENANGVNLQTGYCTLYDSSGQHITGKQSSSRGQWGNVEYCENLSNGGIHINTLYGFVGDPVAQALDVY